MTRRGGLALVRGCAVALAASLQAEAPPAIDLRRLLADAEAWRAAADRLAVAIDEVAARSAHDWREPAELLAALRAKDEVHRLAALVDGYLDLRAAFDHSDAELAALRPRMAELAARWDDGARVAFDARVAALGAERRRHWEAAEPALAPYGWQLAAAERASPRPLDRRERELIAQVDVERRGARQLHAAFSGPESPEVEVELATGARLRVTPALARNLAAEVAEADDRRRALAGWRGALGRRAGSYASLLAAVVRREAFDARVRGFASPLAAALVDEGVTEGAVERELAAGRAVGAAVARAHHARRRLLGLPRYGTADARVPVAGLRTDWTWEETRQTLITASEALGPDVRAVVERAFAEGWIDAAERPRKRPSGFSTYVYGDRPYASVVFRGTTPDLFRLAHEVGHTVHHFLAFEARPYTVARPSILTSEATASLFEVALSRLLGERATGADSGAAIADFEFQTIQRIFVATVLDADFERAVHAGEGELDAAALGELYRDRLVAFHGGALELEESDGFAWIETPHFVTTPFYMPRYGLAFAAALALDERLRHGDPAQRAAAQASLVELLRAGASDSPLRLLARAGADLERAGAFNAVGHRLDEVAARLESAAALAAAAGAARPD